MVTAAAVASPGPSNPPPSNSFAAGRNAGSEEEQAHNESAKGVKRTRRFHHRSRNGCEHCKKRRVRCDEGKPVCGNCVKKGSREMCVYANPPTSRSGSQDEPNPSDASFPTPPLPGSTPQVILDPVDHAGPSRQASTSNPMDTRNTSTPFYAFPSFNQTTTSPGIGIAPPLDPTLDPDLNPPFSSSNVFASADGLFNFPTCPLDSNPDPLAITDIPEIPRPNGFDPPPLSPNTSNMLSMLFGSPRTPPLPNLTWSAQGEEQRGESSRQGGREQSQMPDWGSLGSGAMSSIGGSSQWEMFRHNVLSDAILRQTHILQQPNELATYFPTSEQRRQFCHFLYETSNDLLVVPTDHALNPWILHLSHLALGKASGHEILHDAFRAGLLSLASFDIGLKMRKSSQSPGYAAMYQSSKEQRETALKLLHVGKVLKMYESDMAGADLVLATVAALAIRDRLAGTQDFEPPLKVGVDAIMDRGGAVAYIGRAPSPGRRFLVEQMGMLELLGAMTTWKSPRILSGDMSWFTSGNHHLTKIYGWDRLTIAFTAESMAFAEEMMEVWSLRTTYRKTSYPAIQSALSESLTTLDVKYRAMLRRAADLRFETMIAPLHPRAAIGATILQACMETLLVSDWPDEDKFMSLMGPKCRAILDLCEVSMDRGMYAGLLLPLTWAAICLEAPDQIRLRNMLLRLQPHYHVDPGVLEKVIEIDWHAFLETDPEDWTEVLKTTGLYMPIF